MKALDQAPEMILLFQPLQFYTATMAANLGLAICFLIGSMATVEGSGSFGLDPPPEFLLSKPPLPPSMKDLNLDLFEEECVAVRGRDFKTKKSFYLRFIYP